MTPDAIDALDRAVPGVRQERHPPDNWSGDYAVIADTDDLAGEIEDDLFGDTDGDEAGPPSLLPDSMGEPPDLPSIEAEIADTPLPDHREHPDISILTDQLGGTLGTGFPGAPGASPITGAKGGAVWRPPTDAYAFYLPWHEFPLRLWGIYLIVQGIKALGTDIHLLSRNWLSRAEANRVAQMFLFHHEAYHNVAETFAARLEVSHRRPCYLTGFRKVWHHGFNSGLHEEGLADAYAYEKVRGQSFGDAMPKGPLRTLKRGVAAAAFRRILQFSPPPYDSALRIVSGAVTWDDAEHAFQETSHGACGFGVPPSVPGIWLASGHAMHPSLGRNRKFSYVIDQNHPSLRHAANVPYFSRREFVRRLAIAVAGHEAGGGKHPKVVSSDGKSVPVPGHNELPRGTCRAILRQFGLNVPLSRFMGAMDNELAALRVSA
jgi:hypothetical protein